MKIKILTLILLFLSGCTAQSYPIYSDFVINQIGQVALTGKVNSSMGKQGINTGLYAIKNEQYQQMMRQARGY